MKITNVREQALVGINLNLSNLELVVLAQEVAVITKAIDEQSGHSKRYDKSVRVPAQALNNVVSLLNEITKETISLDDAREALFGSFEEETKQVGRIPLA